MSPTDVAIADMVLEHKKTWELMDAYLLKQITIDQLEAGLEQLREDMEQKYLYGPTEAEGLDGDPHELLGVGA